VELSKAQNAREYWSIKPTAYSSTQTAHAALIASKKIALAAEAEAKSRRRAAADNTASSQTTSQTNRSSRSRTLSPQLKPSGAGAGAKPVVRANVTKSVSPTRRDMKHDAQPASLPFHHSSRATSVSPAPSLSGSSIAQVASRLEELAYELAAQKALAAKAAQGADPGSPASPSKAKDSSAIGAKGAKERIQALQASQRAKHALHISLSSPTGSAAPPTPTRSAGGPAQLTASRDLMATLQRQQVELEQLRSVVSAKGKAGSDAKGANGSMSAEERKAQVLAAFAELKESGRTAGAADSENAAGTAVKAEEDVRMPDWAPAADSDSSDGEPSAALLARKEAAMRQRLARQEAHIAKQAPQSDITGGAPVSAAARPSRRANTLSASAVDLNTLHDAIGVARITEAEMAELKKQDAIVEAKLAQEARAKALAKLQEQAIALINAAALEAAEKTSSTHSSLNSENYYGLDDLPDWAEEAKSKKRKEHEEMREKKKVGNKFKEPVDIIPRELQRGVITEELIQTSHSKYLKQLARAEAKIVPGGARVSMPANIVSLPTPRGARRAAPLDSSLDANVLFLQRELATAREAVALLVKKQELLVQHENINAYTGFAQTDEGYSLGLLQLTIINARELPNKKLVSKVDPYAEVDLVLPDGAAKTLSQAFVKHGGSTDEATAAWKTLREGVLDGQGGYPSSQRTTTQYNTLFPEWREPLVFAPVAALEQYARLRIKDSTRGYTDDTVMAECTLPLDLLKDQCTHRFAISLTRPEDVVSTVSTGTAATQFPGAGNSNGRLPDSCVVRVEGKLVYSKAALNAQRKSEADAKVDALERLLAKVQTTSPSTGNGAMQATATPAPAPAHADSVDRVGRSRYKYGYAYAGFSSAEPPLPASSGGKHIPSVPLECSSAERGRNRLRILGAREKVAVQYGLLERHEHSSRERLTGAFGPGSPPQAAKRSSSSQSKSKGKMDDKPRRGLSMTPASSRSFTTRGMSPSPLRTEIQSTSRASSAPAHARIGMSPAQKLLRSSSSERHGFGSASPTGRIAGGSVSRTSSSAKSFTSASASASASAYFVSRAGRGGSITRPAGTGPAGARTARDATPVSAQVKPPAPLPFQKYQRGSANKPRPTIKVNGVSENGVRAKSNYSRSVASQPGTPGAGRAVSTTPVPQTETPTSQFLRKANANWSAVRKLHGSDAAGTNSGIGNSLQLQQQQQQQQAQQAQQDQIDAETQADIIIARAKERAQKEAASKAKMPLAVAAAAARQGVGEMSPQESFHEALRAEMLAAEAAAKLHATEQQYRRTFRGAYVVHKPRSVDAKATKVTTPIFGATSKRF